MSGAEQGRLHKASELRQLFDSAFVEAPRAGSTSSEDYLAIRLDADAHALSLSEVSRLIRMRGVRRIPSPLPELMGIMGYHGALVPVYDLRMLCGYPAGGKPGWLAVTAGAVAALAFDAFDGHLRLLREDKASRAAPQASRRHVQEVLQADGKCLPVVSLASVLETIRSAAKRGAS